MKGKLFSALFALLLGAIVTSYTTQKDRHTPYQTTRIEAQEHTLAPSSPTQIAMVTKVIDGDTFEIATGQKVRLIGVDTPELHKPNTAVQCFAKEAMLETKRLIEGKQVRLQKDVSETDKYGRLLRYVYIINPLTPVTSSANPELFLNKHLVEQGFARVATFPPDVAYAQLFVHSQQDAEKQGKGLWKECR